MDSDLHLPASGDPQPAEVARLRAAAAAEERFLGCFAHELKGPLHVLSMLFHLLEARSAQRQPVEPEAIARARRQIRRLAGLVNTMLDVSRLQRGKFSVATDETADLAEAARAALGSIEARRAAEVTVAAPGPVEVRADPARLEAMATVLLDNAVRYSDPATPVEVAVEAADGMARLVVRDRGMGVEEAEAVSAFTPFWRSPRAEERARTGLGVGLYVVGAAAARLGGRAWLLPRPGGGAEAGFELPAAP